MDSKRGYAFVDVETTGLNPAENRIAEVAVVTGGSSDAQSWSRFVRTPPLYNGYARPDHPGENAPWFREIAGELYDRLAGRTLVAHNARFDFSFLKSEFARVGIAYDAPVVCTVMLSRSLFPAQARHDLDSLAERHGLRVSVRHRALPDADLVQQWWQAIHRELDATVVGTAIDSLLAVPPLPPSLDPALLSRLPEVPGAYALIGDAGRPLLVAAATNLRLDVVNYFRLDHATARARNHANHVTNIIWRATRGPIGALLHAALMKDACPATPNAAPAAFTWQFHPDQVPCLAVLPFERQTCAESFGAFATECRARNALDRLAVRHRLCHVLAGVATTAKVPCAACPVDQPAGGCAGVLARKRKLLQFLPAITALRIPEWPYAGPIGIRERGDLHVIDEWRFLGTVQREGDLYEVLASRMRPFDARLHRLVRRILLRTPVERVVDVAFASRRRMIPTAEQ